MNGKEYINVFCIVEIVLSGVIFLYFDYLFVMLDVIELYEGLGFMVGV